MKFLQMVTIAQETVEQEIIKAVEELNSNMKLGANIDSACCPGEIKGISSQILVTIMSRLEDSLGVQIPSNVYIFHDKDTHSQLSIEAAAKKLIKLSKKVPTDGKQ